MKTITICSSANFYRQAVEVQAELQRAGFVAVIPDTAEKMKQSGDFEVGHYKTWLADSGDYHKKADLMRGHFQKIERGDAVLVLNYEKHGVQNYIGGNVLMEMALAFYFRQPIFIMNEVPKESAFLEEIKGFGPIVLHGDLGNLASSF